MRNKEEIVKALLYVEQTMPRQTANSALLALVEGVIDIRDILDEMRELKDEEMQRLYSMDMDTGEGEDFEDECEEDNIVTQKREEIVLAGGLGIMHYIDD